MRIKKKICLLGSYGVGKTSLVRRFVYNKFEEKYLSTIGVHVSKKSLHIESSTNSATDIDLLIWDIANIEKFDSVVKNYMRGSHGGIVVVDVTRYNTIEHIKDYITHFREINPDSALTFVGNKVDLVGKDDIDKSEILKFSSEYKTDLFFTSAKTGDNVENMFKSISEHLCKEIC